MMVNATQMGKVFGKKPSDWLRTEQANRIINAVSASQKCEPNNLVVVVNGGDDYGTWMHEDVALPDAQWLSPEFYIWCNERLVDQAVECPVFRKVSIGYRRRLSKKRDICLLNCYWYI